MGKKGLRNRARTSGTVPGEGAAGVDQQLDSKRYNRELARLQGELVKLQFWVKHTGARIVVLFEGRDAAGKGGVIKRITERVSPRVFRLVALPAPSERERSQVYIQRYIPHLPAGGEVVIFDRSWYNRAGVERVMGFCSEAECQRFLEICPRIRGLADRFRGPADQVLVRSEHGRADAPVRGTDQGRPQAVEAEPDGPRIASALVRLFVRQGRNVRRDRHRLQPVVRRQRG